MAEAAKGGGIKGFLGKDTAGLPNWAWIVVVVVGLGAAYVIPRFFGKQATTADNNTTAAPPAPSDNPTLGPGAQPQPPAPIPPTPPAPPAPVPNPPQPSTLDITGPVGIYSPMPGTTPPTPPTPPKDTCGGLSPCSKCIQALAWPNQLGSLSGIASKYGISLQRLEQLNPQITNPDLIQVGQEICIAA